MIEGPEPVRQIILMGPTLFWLPRVDVGVVEEGLLEQWVLPAPCAFYSPQISILSIRPQDETG